MTPMTLQSVVLAATDEAAQSALGPAFADSFWVVVALALAMFLLGYDLIRRLRRAKFRTDIQEELAAEVAERDAAARLADTTTDRPGATPPHDGSVNDSKE